jgi:hypothetical protein
MRTNNRSKLWSLMAVFLIAAFFPIHAQAETPGPNDTVIQDNTIVFLPLIQNGPGGGGIPYPTSLIVIDHRSIASFDHIPDQYIQAAIQIDSLFRHASVGNNIHNGLDCLMNRNQPRPNSCDAGLSPGEIFYNSRYDRTRWHFEFHSPPPGQNPPWWDKLNFFVNRVDGLPQNTPYDVVAFKFGYVDSQPNHPIDTAFFARNPNDPYSGIEDLEALRNRHSNKVIVIWTMGLARSVGTSISTNFNNQLRTYAAQNPTRFPLMDVADIQSHDPNGNPCYDNQGRGLPALCSQYTNETNGGHLNARGMQRMAKAYWVLMARLAGWNGIP